MCIFMNNERGLTLVELLATIVIFSIVAILVTSITVQSLANNEKIKQEIALRNEAELILAHAIKGIYTTLESDIVNVEGNQMYIKVAPSEVPSSADPTFVTCENGVCTVITGFINDGVNTNFYVDSVKVHLSQTDSIISPLSTLIEVGGSDETNSTNVTTQIPTYKITLGLYDQSSKNMEVYWFENEITSINNL